MSYPQVRYNTVTLDRRLSANLWRNSLDEYADGHPEIGSFDFCDFVGRDAVGNTSDAAAQSGWFVQDAAAGGTNENFANVASPDGIAVLSASTGTDHFGIEAHRGYSATTGAWVNLPTHATDARGRVVFETYVDFDESDNWFIGLTEAIVEFLSATGTLPTASDYIGFYRADDGDLKFVCANDNDGGTAVTDSITIIAAADAPTGLQKVGFAVNKDNSVEICVAGDLIKLDTSGVTIVVDEDALPIETLTQKYATTRGATGDLAAVALRVDWCACFVAAG